MLDEEMKNSRIPWKVVEKMEREGWAARRKKKREAGRGNRFLSSSQALFPTNQNPAITNVKVLLWVIISQTYCQCPQESLLFELLQFTSKCIAQTRLTYLIQIGMFPYNRFSRPD